MPAKPWPPWIHSSTAARSGIGRLPGVLANTIASVLARAKRVSIREASAAVRQEVVEKSPDRWPRALIVASAIGMELCLNPSVCVTTRTRRAGLTGVGDVGLEDLVSLEQDHIRTPNASTDPSWRCRVM